MFSGGEPVTKIPDKDQRGGEKSENRFFLASGRGNPSRSDRGKIMQSNWQRKKKKKRSFHLAREGSRKFIGTERPFEMREGH